MMLYFGFGIITMLMGGNFLEYEILTKIGFSHVMAQTIGIFTVECGVLFVVSMGLLKIGYAFSKVFDRTKPNVEI
jgi:multicomponent Na+:H+ antiporter subunit B